MPLFNDRRNSNSPVDVADPRDPSAALPQNKNKRDVMNYTTPKGYIGGANMYGSTYPKATGNGSRYAKDMANINSGLTTRAGRGDAAKRPGDKNGQAYYDKQYGVDAAYQKSWINKGAAASQRMNQSKKWSDNPLAKKYDSGK